MKNEAELCTIIKNSMINGFKIPDPGYGSFTSTGIRVFDGLGTLSDAVFGGSENDLRFICWEAKFLKSMQAFSMKRVEVHQDYYLRSYAAAVGVKSLLLVGIDAGRGDKRVFVFDYTDIMGRAYQLGFSFHKEYLLKLPYNPVKKNLFSFDNIITLKELNEVYGKDFNEVLSDFEEKQKAKEQSNE